MSSTSYSETQSGFELELTDGNKMYPSAKDEKGNSCVKLGTTTAIGSFSFTVPEGVASVIIHAAKYKANATTLTVNGESFTLTKNSNDGEYDAISVDVPESGTITVSTTTSTKRCMINAIEFVLEEVEPEAPTQPAPGDEETETETET